MTRRESGRTTPTTRTTKRIKKEDGDVASERAQKLKVRYFILMQRAVDLLVLLPDPDTVDMSSAAVKTEVEMLLAEFGRIDDEMSKLVKAVKCLH